MRLTLPMPPSANRLWRNFRGHTVLSAEGRAFKAGVAKQAEDAGLSPLDGEVVVRLDVYRARKAGDLDNRVKATLDSLRGVAFHDDSQVVELHAHRHDDKANPRVEVVVEPCSRDPGDPERGFGPVSGEKPNKIKAGIPVTDSANLSRRERVREHGGRVELAALATLNVKRGGR